MMCQEEIPNTDISYRYESRRDETHESILTKGPESLESAVSNLTILGDVEFWFRLLGDGGGTEGGGDGLGVPGPNSLDRVLGDGGGTEGSGGGLGVPEPDFLDRVLGDGGGFEGGGGGLGVSGLMFLNEN